jgi:plasmid rolling circle replication initiator protein Rep
MLKLLKVENVWQSTFNKAIQSKFKDCVKISVLLRRIIRLPLLETQKTIKEVILQYLLLKNILLNLNLKNATTIIR